MSSNSSKDVLADPWVRYFGGTSYAILSAASICANVFLACTFVNGRKQFRKTAFYAIAWQLVVCDLVAQSIQLCIAAPITFTGELIYGNSFTFHAILFFDTIAYNGTLYFSALMTLSRLAVFFLPDELNQRVFSGWAQFGVIASIWQFVVAFVISMNLIGCRKAFSETGFFLYHDCKPADQISPFGTALREFYTIIATYLPVAMLAAYLLLFMHIHCAAGRLLRGVHSLPTTTSVTEAGAPTRNLEERARMRRRERAFLLQSFIICGFLEVQNLAFSAVPYFPDRGQLSFFVNFAVNWVCILLNSVGPISLFTFNTDVRRCARALVYSSRSTSGIFIVGNQRGQQQQQQQAPNVEISRRSQRSRPFNV